MSSSVSSFCIYQSMKPQKKDCEANATTEDSQEGVVALFTIL